MFLALKIKKWHKNFLFLKRNLCQECQDIPNLLINIWSYKEEEHLLNVGNCEICKQYKKWCIEIARSKRKPEFKSFSYVITQIQMQNKKLFNFGKISSQERNCICNAILKKTNMYE